MTFIEKEIEQILQIADNNAKFERFFSLLYIYIDGQHAELIIKLIKQFIVEAEADQASGYDAIFYCSLGYIYLSLGKKELSNECLQIALSRKHKINSAAGKGIFMLYQSIVAWFDGKRNNGFDFIFKSLREFEGSNNHEVLGWSLFTLATYQFDSNQLKEAEENYNKSLAFFKLIDAKYGYARANNGLASIKIKQGKLQEAAAILYEIKDIYIYFDKLSGHSRVITDLGVIESKMEHHSEALKLHQQALQMRLQSHNIPGQITSLTEIGRAQMALKNYSEAEGFLLQAAMLSAKNNFKAKAYAAHELLAQLYKTTGNFEKGMEHLEYFFENKSQVLADESTSRLKVLETQLLAEEASKRAALEKQNNIELLKAYQIIELKNTEILQSIDYAKRIQESILPSTISIENCFKNMFIFYRPKDIVAGDFYWLHKNGSKIFFAVCDCTGHGVPGAFVSLICYNALNKAVADLKLDKPSLILDKVNTLVNEAFSANTNDQINDGMDASLIMFDIENQIIEWAGANNPLWIVDKKSNPHQLFEIKGNKQPIGKFEFTKPFTNHQLPLVKGNNYYIFSDGFADQFGGEHVQGGGKKFSKKRFRDLLINIADIKIKEQLKHFEKTFTEWKLDMEQIDDVLVVGVSF
ncbi:MAG TPA: tetratricopeptide repeat protein [Bacteroidia bacterium]|nr:tetratricopeptide repeat protein [Bacteroidia bacterium]